MLQQPTSQHPSQQMAISITERYLDKIAKTDMNNDYAIGTYYDANVLMKSGTYVNVDALSKALSDGSRVKPYHDWARMMSTERLITFVNEQIQKQTSDRTIKLVIAVTDTQLYNGVYIHYCLIPAFIQWLSPAMMLRVACDVTRYAIQQVHPSDSDSDHEGPLAGIVSNRYGKFASGVYCGINVLILQDQYINVDALADEVIVSVKTSRKYGCWEKMQYASEYVCYIHRYLASIGHDPISLTVIIKRAHDARFIGTYAHYLLIPSILQWLSNHTAMMIANIVNENV